VKSVFEVVRAVRGPILLIVLGVLFALDQAGKLGFERTWPLLFIVYGTLKLIERLIAPPLPPPPAYYPPAGTWQPPAQGGQRS
jgi:hypothetical protein